MSELIASHTQHSTSLSKLGEEQRRLEQIETEMRDMIAKAKEKRSWFSAFRQWMVSVTTFLNEKVRSNPVPLLSSHLTLIPTRLQYPTMKKPEEEHISLMKERAYMIT